MYRIQRSKWQVAHKRNQLTGHILLLAESQPAKAAMDWMPHCGKRHIGRSKKTWEKQKKICAKGSHFDVRVLKLIIIDWSGKKLWPVAAKQLGGTRQQQGKVIKYCQENFRRLYFRIKNKEELN